MIFLCFLALSYQQYIKHAFTSKFMCGAFDEKNFGSSIKSCKTDNASKFVLKKNFDNFFIEADNGMVLDAPLSNKLISWPFRGGPSQQFTFTLYDDNTYLIKNNGLCIEYDLSINEYKKTECNGTKRQLFKIITDKAYEKMKEKFLYKAKEVFDNIKGSLFYKSKDLAADKVEDNPEDEVEPQYKKSSEALGNSLQYGDENNLDSLGQLSSQNQSLYSQSQAMRRSSSYSRRYSYSSSG